jgi:hypothetical protein
MFTKKQYIQIAIMTVALVAVAMWPLSQAVADDYSNPPAKDNSSSGQTKAPADNPKATMPDKPIMHKGALDGKTYTGKMDDPSDKTKMYDETISFKSGKFHSSACDAYGFGMASYTTKKEKDITVFTTETTSDKDGHTGQLKWRGTIKGNELKATAEMIMDGKSSGTSTVKATLETQQATQTK